PMVILVIYSFNAWRLVTVWGGWSIHWYLGLLDNTQLMNAVKRSLQIAFYTATSAVALGTLAAFAMARIQQFRGRPLFSGVITGLSLLLLFVALVQVLEFFLGVTFDRGMLTIWIAHTTFSVAYVAIVVSSRLGELDQSIEEAAMDLGAPPWKTFLLITVPMI